MDSFNPCSGEQMVIDNQSADPPRISRYETLFRVSKAIGAIRDPAELFKALADELHHVVDFNYVMVLMRDEQTQTMKKQVFGVSGLPEDMAPPPFDTGKTVSCWVYDNQQPMVIPCLDQETRFPEVTEYLKQYGIQSICGFPLTTVHRQLGVLAFGSKIPDAYSQEEVCFLSLVASEVALAIDDAMNFSQLSRAEEDLRGQHERLRLLLDLTNTVVSSLELRDVLRTVSASVRRVMHCDAVGVMLPDSDAKNLKVYALDYPESKGFIKEELIIPVETSLPGKAFRTREAVVVGKADPLDIHPEEFRLIAGEGFNSRCFLPLISRDRTLGILALACINENSFAKRDMDFLVQIANQVAIAVENALAYRQIADLKDKLAQEKLYLEDEIRYERNFEEIIGQSSSLLQVLQEVETVAPTDSTVLILGETGTGKELVARAIHNRSRRNDRTFVKLNCAAIPTGLLESELFGHEKGAFTGAIAQRIGRMELADQGTLFLDEVGDIPLELQSKLLRVLQEQEFERLGSTKTKKVDVRLVAATNRDLQKMVTDQQFRSDLYYRLNVFPIRVPALRERPDDIPLLVRHFTQKYARRMEKRIESIPSNVFKKLARSYWPGNIRELENFIERAVILTRGSVLNAPLSELNQPPAYVVNGKPSDSRERDQILQMLRQTNGRVGGPTGAAERLGLKRTTLIARMKKLGIDPRQVS